jgi:hypothetical protein
MCSIVPADLFGFTPELGSSVSACVAAAGTHPGIGSALFHGTLRYNMQMLDELPMVYVIATPCVTSAFIKTILPFSSSFV